MNMGGNVDPALNENDEGLEQDVVNPESVDINVEILQNVSSNTNTSTSSDLETDESVLESHLNILALGEEKDALELNKDVLKTAIEEEDSDNKEGIGVLEV